MEKIERELLQHIASVDLQSLTSPYLPKTFAIWRCELFSSYEGDLFDFIQLVDYTYLPKFLKCIANAYTIAIFSDPCLSEFPRDDESVQEVIKTLAQWSVEIELAVDLIIRSTLYKLYEIPHGYQNLFEELKSEWRIEETYSSKVYKSCLRYISFAAEKANGFVSESVKGYVIENLMHSKGSIIISVFYSYFTRTLPWPVIALLGTQFTWIFSAVLITKIGEKVVVKIDKAKVAYRIEKLKRELQKMTTDLMFRNEASKYLIEKATNLDEENLIALSEHFTKVLSHKRAEMEEQQQFDEDRFIAENAKIKEENGWIVIEPPDVKTQELDDWMVIE